MYVDTIKDLKKALLVDYQRYEQLSSTERLKLSRMTSLLEQLDKSTKELKQGLKTEINGHLEDTGKIAYNELFYEYESKNTAINFTMLKSEELKTIIETPVANYKLSERLNDGVAERLKSNIKSELTRVFLLGYSYKQTAARLAELGYSSYRRALNITRTEASRVQAIARQKSQMEAMKLGVEFEKEWISTLDNRTRSDHAKLDGQRVKPNEDFEVGGLKAKQPHMFGVAAEDCNCRCRTVSRLKNDKTALLRRDNETGKIGKWKNYAEWAKSKNNPSSESEYYLSVKEKWLDKANAHNAKASDKTFWNYNGKRFVVDGRNVVLDYSQKEKEVANWISKTLGKQVELVPRVNNPEGINTPDYLIDGKKYDLKEIAGAGRNVIDGNLRKAKKQAENIIFDITKTKLSDDEIIAQLEQVYKLGRRGLNVAIIKDGENLVDILKPKK